MARLSITIGYLYPDIMSTYGDRGNVATIRRRCGWRGIGVELTELRLGDRVNPEQLDLIMIGGGGESQQRLVAADLYKVKGAGIRDAVAQGAAALAVGGGFELFGRFCQPGQGAEYQGIELFDAWTIRQQTVLGDHYRSISEARADRVIGELVVRWGGRLLVGFENHSGGTYIGAAARPLGQVLSGHGNNGDGTEGVIAAGAIGTNLRGPCLPKNPALADFLIVAALRRRHGAVELEPLADELEQAAHEAAIRRAWQGRRAARAGQRRPALLTWIPGGAGPLAPAHPALRQPDPAPWQGLPSDPADGTARHRDGGKLVPRQDAAEHYPMAGGAAHRGTARRDPRQSVVLRQGATRQAAPASQASRRVWMRVARRSASPDSPSSPRR